MIKFRIWKLDGESFLNLNYKFNDI